MSPAPRLALGVATLMLGAALCAAEPSGRALMAQCQAYADDPESEEGQRCLAFVAGFLAGVAASDAASRPGRETYLQRALRTRLGVRLAGGASTHCVDAATSHDILIGQLLAHGTERANDGDVAAGDLMSETLERFHSCDLMDYRRSL
jgi:hypothetical protein